MAGIIAFPHVVQQALQDFGDLFANEPQRRHFAEYLTGLYVADRKTVSGINAQFANSREQNITPEQQAQALGIDVERLTALSSSRMPRDVAEVSMVAARMGCEASRLADLLGVTLDL